MSVKQRNSFRVFMIVLALICGAVASYYSAKHFVDGRMIEALVSLLIAVICGQQIVGRLDTFE